MSKISKRERRPNVRLEEIGDLPAAVSFIHKFTLQKCKRRCDSKNTDVNASGAGCTFDSVVNNNANTDFVCLDSFKVEACSTTADIQQNIENTNPNSWKPGSGLPSSVGVELDKPKVEFKNVPKKRRLMNRKTHFSNFGNGSYGSAWNDSRLESYDSVHDRKKHTKTTDQFNSFGSSDIYPTIWNTDHSGPEFSTASKQNSEDYLTKHPLDTTKKNISDEFGHQTHTGQMSEGLLLYGVDQWLEERGFGKYVELFEIHEVDEEALPLLTFEDLREVGVEAVGHRRKLYNAIRQLKGNDSYAKIA